MAGWVRLYLEIRHDRKLKRVSHKHRWLWIVMMTFAAESPDPGWLLLSAGVPVSLMDLAEESGISLKEVKSGIKAFIEVKMVEKVDGFYHLVNWDKRQFKSDNSTDRWRKWKDRQEAQPSEQQTQPKSTNQQVNQIHQQLSGNAVSTFTNVGPTSPDTEADTEAETEINTAADGVPARENTLAIFEQEFGRLISPAELEALGQYGGTAEGEALVCEAIRRTRARGSASVRYAVSILESWREQGVVNLAGVGRADLEFVRRKKFSPRASPPEAGPLSAGNEAKRAMIRSLYRN